MGSFNVSCGISKISIREGMEVRFIPLQPANIYKPVHSLAPATVLLHPNVLFNPMTFPIKGICEDRGAVSNIERNFNAEIIEKRYKLPMEEIIECIACTRSINDRNGEIFDKYAINKEAVQARYPDGDTTPLLLLGFQKETRTLAEGLTFEGFTHPKLPTDIFMVIHRKLIDKNRRMLMGTMASEIAFNEEGNDYYTIFDGKKAISSGFASDFLKEFLGAIYLETKVHINFNKEDYHIIDELRKASGMYIIEEVYQTLISKHEGVDEWVWNRIEDLTNSDKQNIVEELRKTEELIKKRDSGEDIAEVEIRRADPLSHFNIDDFFSIDEIRKWNVRFFQETYLPAIPRDDFFEEVKNYHRLFHSMEIMSKHFSPTLNGRGQGDYLATKVLAEKTLEITNRIIKEIEEF